MLDDDSSDNDPYIQQICDILERCKTYTTKNFNDETKQFLKGHGGMLFQNIDGNRTNFDTLSIELQRLQFRFPIIGLAETNVNIDDSSVYQLDGYKSFYQDKHVNKIKGTGVALYIDEKFNAVINEELSWVTKNLETLFVTVHHDQPLHIGVVYRPPSGNPSEAIAELAKIIELGPKKNVYLLGDYNIDLHDVSNRIVQEFESMVLGMGFSPLISTYSHQRPGCKRSCIDNILATDLDKVVLSGSLSTCISHHHAVFHIFNSPIFADRPPTQKHFQYYDYSSENISKFTQALEQELLIEAPDNFNNFSRIFSYQLDRACKLERPKSSKRTPHEQSLDNYWAYGLYY